MDKHQLGLELLARGWEKDRYGHYHKEMKNKHDPDGEMRRFRVKIQTKSVRVEFKVTVDEGLGIRPRTTWIRLSGAYYKNIVITSTNKLLIGTMAIGGGVHHN